MNEVCKMFVGYKVMRCKNKKGNAWWTEEKKKACGRMLEGMYQWKNTKICKWNIKKLREEGKERVDEDFRRKLSGRFWDIKKLFWKEVKKEWGWMLEWKY